MNANTETPKNQPLLTVIVAALNNADTLERCIKSIIDQTYPHKELIAMNAASSDGSLSIIDRYKQHLSYWESKQDLGIYDSWYKALKHTHGEWTRFLRWDEYFWHEEVLTELTPHLKKARGFDTKIVYMPDR